MNAYVVSIRSGKLEGWLVVNAESREGAEAAADEELEGMGWQAAGVVWDRHDSRTLLAYEREALDANFAANPYEVVSIVEGLNPGDICEVFEVTMQFQPASWNPGFVFVHYRDENAILRHRYGMFKDMEVRFRADKVRADRSGK